MNHNNNYKYKNVYEINYKFIIIYEKKKKLFNLIFKISIKIQIFMIRRNL